MKKVLASIIGIVLCTFLIQLNDLSVVHAENLREEAVKLAASQVGYHEKNSTDNIYDYTANSGSNNYTKYAISLSVTYGQPWNATFFWWVMDAVGVPGDVYPARTTVTSEWFVERGMFRETVGYIPQPGDYIILGDREQCGIVESVDEEKGTVTYIAGNISDAVARVTRDMNDEYIYGYGLIDYEYVYEPVGMYLGDNYCAILLRTNTRKPLRNYIGYPVLWTEVERADYRWLFKKQEDGTYIIQSLYDGRVLEVKDGGAIRNTEVVMADIRTENNEYQKWYVCQNDTGVRLIPQHATNYSLNIVGEANVDGTKLNIHQHNDKNAQNFSLYAIDYVGLTGIAIDSGYDKTMYVNDKQMLEYELVPDNACSNMVEWVSSDNSVVEIDQDGIVVAKKSGIVTIICKSTFDNTISDKITIQVREKPTEQEATADEQGSNIQEGAASTEKQETTTENVSTKEEETSTETTVSNKKTVVKNGIRIKGKQCWFIITSVKKKTVKVIGASNKKTTHIKIPATVKYKGIHYKVTAIGKKAFKNNKKINSVTIGNNVATIQESAFYGCKQLKNVVIGKKVAVIGKTAFYNCIKLQVIKIQSTKLKKIGSKAFKKIDKNPIIYAPKKKMKKYQKLFEGKI